MKNLVFCDLEFFVWLEMVFGGPVASCLNVLVDLKKGHAHCYLRPFHSPFSKLGPSCRQVGRDQAEMPRKEEGIPALVQRILQSDSKRRIFHSRTVPFCTLLPASAISQRSRARESSKPTVSLNLSLESLEGGEIVEDRTVANSKSKRARAGREERGTAVPVNTKASMR